ncbi:DNA ligase D [Flavobacterium sp.]|uniref:DNA ligase D n=1 Tax=Flavobacterium sp. TaxID=239 RepID=UPI0039E65B4B
MTLAKYNQKRDFKKTAEPKGIPKTSKGQLRFVVQKHAASHLHYDFRLEIGGVLVSWAIPKGPSANPSDKRLAMHVEDHPMDYIDFEGTIPKGEYGGGTVMVWDIGTYEPEGEIALGRQNAEMKKQHKAGSIKIVLHGKKLKGSWALVEMHGRGENQWLLIKHKDEFSGTDIDYNPYSILTKRDFEAIAKGNDEWKSNRLQKVKTSDTKAETPKGEQIQSKSNRVFRNHSANGSDEFSADDLAEAKKRKRFPSGWRPQLATLTDEPFDNPEWLFENKWDGYRALAKIKNNMVELVSRNGISFNQKYPEIVQTLQEINSDMILDGEIVVEDSKGKSHFQWLQHLDDNPKRGNLKFYVFDILYFQGFDLRALELIQRKKILKAVLPKEKNIVYSEHILEHGIKLFKTIENKGGEGLIAKKIHSTYHTDKRSKDWLKIKTQQQQEMVIGGFTEPSGSRTGIGALLCGYYDGKDLVYTGKVGSGYTEAMLEELRQKLDKLERKTCPFSTIPKEKNVHWVKPEMIAQVKFSEITESGSMRHPVYLGLREDKKSAAVQLEKPMIESNDIGKTQTKKKMAKDSKSKTENENGFGRVTFTNTDKIYFPNQKITKGDVIAYYDRIADYILPYLKDRPESLRRTPDGLKSEGFFQKNVAGTVPKWIKTRKIKSGSKAESIEYLLCQDKETLLFLANYGCIELNPWSSRVGSLNHPDHIIFDLDPKGAPIKNIVATAIKLKEILDSLKVPAYVKTSGGNGLHVFIPVEPKYTYDQTREFSHLVSQMVHRDLPKITSLERMPDKRKGKVYLDFLQNGKGKTMASIYSLRPREGAGVSTPLQWDEVNDKLDLKKFNIKTLPKRLEEKGDLWKDFFRDAIDLKQILQQLGD